MSNVSSSRLRWRNWRTFVRKHWWQLLLVGIVASIVSLALHVDLRQALTNPVVLLIAGIIIGLHILGAVIAAIITLLARNRWRK